MLFRLVAHSSWRKRGPSTRILLGASRASTATTATLGRYSRGRRVKIVEFVLFHKKKERNSSVVESYKAVADYHPADQDEMRLEEGAEVHVLEKNFDGWWKVK